jgi:hypothetical protein
MAASLCSSQHDRPIKSSTLADLDNLTEPSAPQVQQSDENLHPNEARSLKARWSEELALQPRGSEEVDDEARGPRYGSEDFKDAKAAPSTVLPYIFKSPVPEHVALAIDPTDPRLTPLLAVELARLRANKTHWETALAARAVDTAVQLDRVSRLIAKLNGPVQAQITAADGILHRMRETHATKAAQQTVIADEGSVDVSFLPAEEAARCVWTRMRAFCKANGNLRASDLFFECDKDRSGKINAPEFASALRRMGVVGASTKLAAAVLHAADPNGDCQLDYKELLHALKARHPLPPAPQPTGRPFEVSASTTGACRVDLLPDAALEADGRAEANAAAAVAVEARGLQADATEASTAAAGSTSAAGLEAEAAAAAAVAQEADELARETIESMAYAAATRCERLLAPGNQNR